jgi:hypothetical protein
VQVFPHAHCGFIFSTVYLVCNLTSILTVMRFQRSVASPVRIWYGLVGYLVALSAVPLGEWWTGRGSKQGGSTSYLALVICSIALAGLCDGLAQPAIYGQAAQLSPGCVQVRICTCISSIIRGVSECNVFLCGSESTPLTGSRSASSIVSQICILRGTDGTQAIIRYVPSEHVSVGADGRARLSARPACSHRECGP